MKDFRVKSKPYNEQPKKQHHHHTLAMRSYSLGSEDIAFKACIRARRVFAYRVLNLCCRKPFTGF